MAMQEFDPIIGYTSLKHDLEQIADTLRNPESYAKLGVRPPCGLLLYGNPGLGKTLMANCLIAASKRETFVIRKDSSGAEFVKSIKKKFKKAAQNAPSIVFLDDLDKFANEDTRHRDAEEYVAVQACIDKYKNADVFVLATANEYHKLPGSLVRSGRFDRTMEVDDPEGRDSELIIAHYLSKLPNTSNVDIATVARIMDGYSCADLEAVINEAGLYAGRRRKDSIDTMDFVYAALRTVFDVTPPTERPAEDTHKMCADHVAQVAWHEAGHAVANELLRPGHVVLVTMNAGNGKISGFTKCWGSFDNDPITSLRSGMLTKLAGAAAVELAYGFHGAGASSDISAAFRTANHLIGDECYCGFSLYTSYEDSPDQQRRIEEACAIEVEKAYHEAKRLLSHNQAFLRRVAEALMERSVLLGADIQALREEELALVPETDAGTPESPSEETPDEAICEVPDVSVSLSARQAA